MLSPLLTLLVMNIVFSSLLGSDIPHYTIYLFSGQLVYSFFNEATNQGMTALLDNAEIFTKVNVPKYMFLFSKNVSSLINFGLTLIIYFIFDGYQWDSHYMEVYLFVVPDRLPGCIQFGCGTDFVGAVSVFQRYSVFVQHLYHAPDVYVCDLL